MYCARVGAWNGILVHYARSVCISVPGKVYLQREAASSLICDAGCTPPLKTHGTVAKFYVNLTEIVESLSQFLSNIISFRLFAQRMARLCILTFHQAGQNLGKIIRTFSRRYGILRPFIATCTNFTIVFDFSKFPYINVCLLKYSDPGFPNFNDSEKVNAKIPSTFNKCD